MGFAVIVIFAMLFATFVVIGNDLFLALTGYEVAIHDAKQEQFDRLSIDKHASINITNVTIYNSTTNTSSIYVDNIGSVALDPDYVYLIIDSIWQPESNISHDKGGEYWDPSEIIEIDSSTVLNCEDSIPHVFKVIAENGVQSNEFNKIC